VNQEQWQLIRELFELASQLPSEHQQDLVVTQAKDDQVVIDKVLSMLATQNSETADDQFIAQKSSLSQLVSDSVNEVFSQPEVLQTGDVVENFTVLSCIGEGGMGSVFLAERRQADFSQFVAIKVIHRRQTDASIELRFKRERQILASLNHKNIASFIGGGEIKQGQPYIILEYITGVPITQYCASKSLTVKQRLTLFQQVLSAVSYAHQNFVVHRDIKPNNVLVTEEGEVKLLDFGIAKLIQPEQQTLNAELTQQQDRVLTPGNASPEQVLGEAITTRSDVYGLGSLLMHMLTDQAVFDTKALNSRQIENLILEKTPNKPSYTCSCSSNKRLKKRASILRGELDTVVLKALHKSPDRRYSSAEQFAEDIQRYLSNYPIIAKPDSTWYVISKFLQRNTMSATIGALFIVSLLASSFIISRQSEKIAQERDVAIQQAAIAEQTAKYLLDIFDSADPNVNDGEMITAKMLLDSAYKKLNTLDTAALTKANLTLTLSRVYGRIGEYPKASSLMDRALTFAEQVPEDDPKKLELEFMVVIERGDLLLTLGEYSEAADYFAQQLNLAMTIPSIKNQLPLSVYEFFLYRLNFGLASALGYQDQNQQALEYYVTAMNLAERTPSLSETYLSLGYFGYGSVLRHLGKFEQSAQVLVKGIALERRLHDMPTLDLAHGLNQIASTLYNMGKYAEALPYAQEGLDIRRDIHEYGNVEVVASLGMLANIFARTEQLEQAILIRKESLEMIANTLGTDHPFFAQITYVLGRLYYLNGDYSTAQLNFLNAHAMFKILFPKGNVLLAGSSIGLGQIALQNDKLPLARKHFQEALEILDNMSAKRNVMRAKATGFYAVTRIKLDNSEEAKIDLEDAYAMMETLYTKQSVQYVQFDKEIKLVLGSHF
jgi:serine/threonine-protein kinase